MTFQIRVREFVTRHGLRHQPQTHALDLVSEVGEAAKAVLEASDYGRQPVLPTRDLQEELGDVFYSLIALAESLGVDLEASLDVALSKYESRLVAKGHCGSGTGPLDQEL